MRALVKQDETRGLTLMDVPEPVIGPNDVLIEVVKAAICGTDLHIANWDDWAARTIVTPMVVGHEFMGRVRELGDEVSGLHVGQRVSAEGHLTCGHCRNCRAGRRQYCANTIGIGVNRDGAFADFISVPAANVFPIPDGITDDVAAILDPLGNATHTALEYDLVGEDVLITGAGPIGAMAAAIARHVGARNVVITDVNPHRLEIASRMGVDRAIDPTEASLDDVMDALGMTEGFDVGLEMSGAKAALHQMIESMITGGKIALLGIPAADQVPIDWNDIIFKGLTVKGIYGRKVFETWYKMTTMLQTGLDITPAITHHFSVDDHAAAFAALASGECGKVIIDWAS
jgi:threonine 3-dehydrogenase